MNNFIRPIFKRDEEDFPTDFEEISDEKLVDIKTYVSTDKLVKSFIVAGNKLQSFRNYEFHTDDNQRFDQAGDFYEETQYDLDNLNNVRNDVINELKNNTTLEHIEENPKSEDVSEEEKSIEEPAVENPTDSQES